MSPAIERELGEESERARRVPGDGGGAGGKNRYVLAKFERGNGDQRWSWRCEVGLVRKVEWRWGRIGEMG